MTDREEPDDVDRLRRRAHLSNSKLNDLDPILFVSLSQLISLTADIVDRLERFGYELELRKKSKHDFSRTEPLELARKYSITVQCLENEFPDFETTMYPHVRFDTHLQTMFELREDPEAATEKLRRCLRELYYIVADLSKNLIASKIEQNEAKVFWLLSFGKSSSVPFTDLFWPEFRHYMQKIYWFDFERFGEDVMSLVQDCIRSTLAAKHKSIVTPKDFNFFLLRFGPMKITYTKCLTLCDGLGQPVPWFLPTTKVSTARQVLEQSHDAEFVVRFSTEPGCLVLHQKLDDTRIKIHNIPQGYVINDSTGWTRPHEDLPSLVKSQWEFQVQSVEQDWKILINQSREKTGFSLQSDFSSFNSINWPQVKDELKKQTDRIHLEHAAQIADIVESGIDTTRNPNPDSRHAMSSNSRTEQKQQYQDQQHLEHQEHQTYEDVPQTYDVPSHSFDRTSNSLIPQPSPTSSISSLSSAGISQPTTLTSSSTSNSLVKPQSFGPRRTLASPTSSSFHHDEIDPEPITTENDRVELPSYQNVRPTNKSIKQTKTPANRIRLKSKTNHEQKREEGSDTFQPRAENGIQSRYLHVDPNHLSVLRKSFTMFGKGEEGSRRPGTIDESEFKGALTTLGYKLNAKQFAKVWEKAIKDDQKRINFDMFVEIVVTSMASYPRVLGTMRARIKKGHVSGIKGRFEHIAEH